MLIKKFINKYETLLVAIMLLAMLMLSLLSMKNDSAIVDEVAHIPAGYSYLKFMDYRLNPEHPPLIKDLSAIPLMFMDLKFPTNIDDWRSEPNGQWEVGWHFLYHIGNNAQKILFFSRLPILILSLIFGLSIYLFSKKRFGIETAMLALLFYCFSPNIIAHSKFVTTDLGIAAFIFFAFWAFFNFIDNPKLKTLWWAGLFLALVQLTKFSAIILYPIFASLCLLAVIFFNSPKNLKKRIINYLGGFSLISIISFLFIWLLYIPHTLNMDSQMQRDLILSSLPNEKYNHIINLLSKIQGLPFGKALSQYLLGLAMVFNRLKSGNTTYFLGEVTNQSFFWYFPVTYALKTPLSFLILSLISLVYTVYQYFKNIPLKFWKKFTNYINNSFVEFSFIIFIIIYSYLSITGNLNLGIRHLFPIMPFLFILVSKKIVELAKNIKSRKLKRVNLLLTTILLLWYIVSTIINFPNYVSYFNEIAGGGDNANKYFTDSNVDWGQDLIRLKEYLNKHPEIDEIAIDYFGGADPRYYFCQREYDEDGLLIENSSGYNCEDSKYVSWNGENGVYDGKYIAISQTYLYNDIYWMQLRNDSGYSWLRDKNPIEKIGNSIYLYKLK